MEGELIVFIDVELLVEKGPDFVSVAAASARELDQIIISIIVNIEPDHAM
ncbi:MAG: hypothetical protein HC810_00770 [Acaryochloridaceae cyanobacterium RL_2_7]|nr:hypothetical protein [Acaryochloridaceae cyanobacterium RL_2_7]